MTGNGAQSENWGELGPAMRALPNERYRDFVRYYVIGKPGAAPLRLIVPPV
jgi:hypothetical protein